ncbi:hypothetical protein VP01_818g1 [Puccinia sorghi]|uniref:Uncharacterized protein n=1 Tax=Puccinia sorghi TaxID=27349 RepID=A0A0L6UA45_9BASI|nr:hypothetical protein VP01_818g1 [Puccinia sorghi]
MNFAFLNEPKKPGSKIYPKGSRGRLIGYNEDLLSYRILADDGRIVDTKSVQFLEFRPEENSFKLDDEEEFEIIFEKESPSLNHVENDKEIVEIQNEEYAEVKQEPMSDPVSSSNILDISSDSDDEEITELLNPIPPTRVLRERTTKIKPMDPSC